MDRRLLIVTLALASATGWFAAAHAAEPIQVAKLPFLEIFSPTFFWSDEADVVRTGSTNCPKGRAIAGGLSIAQGQASLRIVNRSEHRRRLWTQRQRRISSLFADRSRLRK